MADSFRIQSGLPAFPNDQLQPQIYSEMVTVYQAIQNLLRGVSQYCGIDAPATEIQSQVTYAETLLSGNLTRLYPIASVGITRGQAVNLFNNAGVLNARLAQATSATTLMHGVANTTVIAGQRVEINFLRGLLDSIGGMTLGSLYYLSTVAGAIQSARPSAAGNIIQSAGFALDSGTFALETTLQYIQL